MNCAVCGKPAVFMCDYPVNGCNCDAPLCPQCRINMGVKDYCPRHAPLVYAHARVTRPEQTIVIEDDGYPD